MLNYANIRGTYKYMQNLNYKDKYYFGMIPLIKRHFKSSVPYFTMVKLINVVLAKFEEKFNKIKVKSKPYFLKLEPTNRCNLRCEGCLHSADRTDLEDNNYLGQIEFETFQKIINDLEKYLIKVSLYLLGEPLIYKDIVKMIKYLNDRKIGSVISSNLNFLTPELAQDLVKNKLTYLIVSLDGYDEESYQKYRKGGSFQKVIDNIKLIQAEKAKQDSKYPMIEIQTLKLDYLTDQDIEKIEKIAKDLNVDRYSIKQDLHKQYNNPNPVKKTCFWLYGMPNIHWNGTVQPCCYYYQHKNNNFGNINQDSILNIWNNQNYQTAREYFKSGKKQGDLKCYSCALFKPKKN